MSGEILAVEQMRYSYIGGDGKFTVSLPALVLRPGDFVGLVGSSGSGKSTLLDILGLVRKPAISHRFDIVGLPVDGQRPVIIDVSSLWMAEDDSGLSRIRANNLGYVLQSGGLLPFLCVGENIELPRRIAGLPVSRNDTLTAMQALGLEWGYHKPVSDLSGGERQRVAILRAISHRPKLILADEPTAAVDTQRAREVVSILGSMAADYGSAVVMVSHDRELTANVANRILTLKIQDDCAKDETLFTAMPDSTSVAS